jgi:hypothetical protein
MNMKKISAFVILLACLQMTPFAWAAWGSFVSTGTAAGFGDPSCANFESGGVACAVRSGTSTMMVNIYSAGKWGKWENLAGTVTSDPSCTSDGKGHVFCAATASNGNLQVTELSGGKWSNPVALKATLFSAPSCAMYTAGEVLCAARNSAGGLAWSLYNGTTWSAFANLTTKAFSAPSCTTDNNAGVVCAVYTTGFVTLVDRFAAGKWEGFLNIGGIASGTPGCTSLDAGGNVVCFAEGYSSSIYATRYTAGSWAVADWSPYGGGLGGEVNTNANCTSQTAGELVCGVYAVGPYNSQLYANVYNGSGWTGWGAVGGAGVGLPSCAPLGTGEVICVVMGSNNKLTSVVGP